MKKKISLILSLENIPTPEPRENEVLIQVSTCGVCHTELDIIEGRTPPRKLPLIPGHEVIGRVIKKGTQASRFHVNDRVGLGWFFASCGDCHFCLSGRENLCSSFQATGRDADGGYAEYIIAPEYSPAIIPDSFSDTEAAPLLCAGSIGSRSLQLSNLKDGQNLGLTGFGASGHLILQIARYQFPNSKVFVFARRKETREFALELGASWTGSIEEKAPEKLEAIIDTTPAWGPVVEALKNLNSGGRLIINAIRKEEDDKKRLLNLNYEDHLWLEKEIKSVANITREDIEDFLYLAASANIKPKTQTYSLEKANQALLDLKQGKGVGAKVLII